MDSSSEKYAVSGDGDGDAIDNQRPGQEEEEAVGISFTRHMLMVGSNSLGPPSIPNIIIIMIMMMTMAIPLLPLLPPQDLD